MRRLAAGARIDARGPVPHPLPALAPGARASREDRPAAPDPLDFSFEGPGARAYGPLAAGTVRFAAVASTLLARALPPAGYRRIERSALRAAARVLRMRIDASGLEFTRGGPFIVAPLHEGLADPLALARLPLPLRYLTLPELWEWRSVGRLLRSGRHIAAPQQPPGRARDRLLDDADAAVHRGDSVVVFPQGSVLGIELGFRPGAFWLAGRLGVPLLPVVLTGTHRVWEHPFSSRVRLGQPVTLQVLPPVLPERARGAARDLERRMRRMALEAPAPVRHFAPGRDGYWDAYTFRIATEYPALRAEMGARRRAVRSGRAGE